jgi:hypothetical protein
MISVIVNAVMTVVRVATKARVIASMASFTYSLVRGIRGNKKEQKD